MCARRSNRLSSTQRGSESPHGAGSSRQRHHGTSCNRPAARSTSASTVGRGRPAGAENTALKPTCMCDCADSSRRNEPSSADNGRPCSTPEGGSSRGVVVAVGTVTPCPWPRRAGRSALPRAAGGREVVERLDGRWGCGASCSGLPTEREVSRALPTHNEREAVTRRFLLGGGIVRSERAASAEGRPSPRSPTAGVVPNRSRMSCPSVARELVWIGRATGIGECAAQESGSYKGYG